MKVKIEKTLCDLCKKEIAGKPHKVEITADGKKSRLDVCQEDWPKVQEIAKAGEAVATRARAKGGRSKLTTMEEIEAKKAQQS